MSSFWQATHDDGVKRTVIRLHHPQQWQRSYYSLETNGRRDTQVAEPTPEDVAAHRRLA